MTRRVRDAECEFLAPTHAAFCEIIQCDPHPYIRPCESETRIQSTRPYTTLRCCTLENGGCSFLTGGSSRRRAGDEKGRKCGKTVTFITELGKAEQRQTDARSISVREWPTHKNKVL